MLARGNQHKGGDDETWPFDADGGKTRKLPIPSTDAVDDWSPDRKRCVTVRCLLQEEGPLTPDVACWSPDGKQLAVLRLAEDRKPEDSNDHLQIMDADGADPRPLVLADATVTWLGHADW